MLDSNYATLASLKTAVKSKVWVVFRGTLCSLDLFLLWLPWRDQFSSPCLGSVKEIPESLPLSFKHIEDFLQQREWQANNRTLKTHSLYHLATPVPPSIRARNLYLKGPLGAQNELVSKISLKTQVYQYYEYI